MRTPRPGAATDRSNATRNVDVKLAKLSKEWRVVREVFANNCVRQHRDGMDHCSRGDKCTVPAVW